MAEKLRDDDEQQCEHSYRDENLDKTKAGVGIASPPAVKLRVFHRLIATKVSTDPATVPVAGQLTVMSANDVLSVGGKMY